MPTRFIKESITTSESLNAVSEQAENLFYRLVVICDDYGRHIGTSKALRARCYPYRLDIITEADITARLIELRYVGRIVLYMNNGKLYLELLNWRDHQQVRAHASKCPAPDDDNSQVLTDDIICTHLLSDAKHMQVFDSKCARSRCDAPVISVISNHGYNGEDIGVEGEEEQIALTLTGNSGKLRKRQPVCKYTPEQFEEWWKLYGKKVGRAKCDGPGLLFDFWIQRTGFDVLMRSTRNYLDFCRQTDRTLKDPATFLSKTENNVEEWRDGIPADFGKQMSARRSSSAASSYPASPDEWVGRNGGVR